MVFIFLVFSLQLASSEYVSLQLYLLTIDDDDILYFYVCEHVLCNVYYVNRVLEY